MQLFHGVSCADCVRLKIEGLDFVCEAFPQGIPKEILSGEHDHKTPFKGDNGILFKLRTTLQKSIEN